MTVANRHSSAKRKNPDLVALNKDASSTVADIARLAAGTNAKLAGTVVLVGGADLLHFRLRVAQSHLRTDLLPSFWSHVGVIVEEGNRARLAEVPLDPPRGFTDMPASNGVRFSTLSAYDDRKRFPNVAALRFPIDAAAVRQACKRTQGERGLLDLGALILPWLGFAWGAGGGGNPLLTGQGIPSAVFTEQVFASLGLDLTPGLAGRTGCPEAIWQAACWWYQYYSERSRSSPQRHLAGDADEGSEHLPASGVYHLGQISLGLVIAR